jgi:S-adenosylmethionine-diacylgycerolhomoserine-N-methlytransferase
LLLKNGGKNLRTKKEMVLYDFLAPAYDFAFESIYRPYRARALELLPEMRGASVLDLACGTGQNFPLLAARVGVEGKIIGVDNSSGMLRRAARRAARAGMSRVSLIEMDAACLDPVLLEAQAGRSAVDFVVCTYSFTSMPAWKAAFYASWELLKPGGGYLIHDIDGTKRNFHVFAVELATRSDFSQKIWQPLEEAGFDFRMDYLDPSAHLFGGRLFAAYAEKPPVPTRSSPCPS